MLDSLLEYLYGIDEFFGKRREKTGKEPYLRVFNGVFYYGETNNYTLLAPRARGNLVWDGKRTIRKNIRQAALNVRA
jgi:hypothetical protein